MSLHLYLFSPESKRPVLTHFEPHGVYGDSSLRHHAVPP